MCLQYPYHTVKVVAFKRHTMKIFDSSNCGKAMSDERVQIEPANLPLWRRIQRALGFDRIFTDRSDRDRTRYKS
jgi:hypothetical protein